MATRNRTPAFDLEPGRLLLGKYEVVRPLGSGWEGASYLLRERSTRVERAGKLFFPSRNPGDRTARRYARKLHRLARCRILVDYTTWEHVELDGVEVTLLVSEFVRGQPLNEFLRARAGKRLHPFEGLHLLQSLARGVAEIHRHREYHGDLHDLNIIVERFGLTCDLRLLDLFDRGAFCRERVEDDLCDMVRIFYDAVGGQTRYAAHPPYVKEICCGLKRSLIIRRFRSARGLAEHLEALDLARTPKQLTRTRSRRT